MKSLLVPVQLIATLSICFSAINTMAQSGSIQRAQPSGGSSQRAPAGSGAAGSASRAAKPALDGYCAVCLADMTQWVAGKPEFEMAFDGRTYRFPGQEQMAKFQADPVRYAPVLGGDDVVAFAQTGRRVPGQAQFGAKHEGRFFFFANQANKQIFMSDPVRYTNADIALGGDCAVCKVDMNAKMAGDPKFSALHDGQRYYFVADQQRQQFLAAPQRYAASNAGSGTKQGSATQGSGNNRASAPAGSGSGSR
jgi:YHS domain-containing protein